MSVFEILNAVNVNDHTEKKGKLTYLSWAWAWAEVKKRYPEATYTIYETSEGVNYFTDGRTCWVKTGVTIEGLEHIEYLPIMDNYHNSISLAKLTSYNVNTAIQRSLTKACARHGLGLYIYAGEDLPNAEEQTEEQTEEPTEEPTDSAEPMTDEEASEKARAETINEMEWKALQSYIVSLAPSRPENQKDMKRLIDDVLARFGHTSDLWREITVGTQVDIRKAERDIKDDLAKNAWKEALG